MRYELAKQLKDAGYPIKTIAGDSFEAHDFIEDNKRCLFPTLPELIEACGERFGALHLLNGNWYCFEQQEENEHKGKASTPEEAVAKLWLELNKPSPTSEVKK